MELSGKETDGRQRRKMSTMLEGDQKDEFSELKAVIVAYEEVKWRWSIIL